MYDFLTYLAHLFNFDQEHPLLFTQFNFWAFFFIVFAIFCAVMGMGKYGAGKPGAVRHHANGTPYLPKGHRLARNGYLTLVSLLFYYKTSGDFVILLLVSTLIGYFAGRRMDVLALKGMTQGGTITPQWQWKRKTWMISAVAINLFILFYFKYAYFFTEVVNTICDTQFRVTNYFALWANQLTSSHFDASQILLPVGISFFTFQNISYIADVYRRKVAHADNILDFGFYTTFFPQLVAGPIIRADQFVPQLYKPYFLTKRQFGIALFWIINGLMKKIILADYLAVNFVDRVFDNPTLFTPFENFCSLFVYSLQVYADFSGYTDIAIGVAMMMGFYLPKNFHSPYKATNAAGFWKRWHISLSNWLKDYLYIPLGGNRNGTVGSYLILGGMLAVVALMAKTQWVTITVVSVIVMLAAIYILFPGHRKEYVRNINNMDTMLLGGMWHGASFNFITWGALNGFGILIYKYWKKVKPWPRIVITGTLFAGFAVAAYLQPLPVLHLGLWWTGIMFAGTVVRYIIYGIGRLAFHTSKADPGGKKAETPFATVWNVVLTFAFISFTRLFFRSGSNLHPSEANEMAWRTARQMVNQIGSHWQLEQVWPIVQNYLPVFIIFIVGMIIHWLPDHFKRRYRLWFANLPLWLMGTVTILAVFIIYQFITADLQPFIYFQF